MPRAAPALLLLLAGCATPVRLAVPPAPAGEPIGVGVASVEVLDASLPLYAEGEEIFERAPGYALAPTPGAVWADDPARALTLDLVRVLGEVTGARVAAEPWPFAEGPEAQVDLRVSEFAADGAGAFVIAGQAFVGGDEPGRDRAIPFSIAVPLGAEGGPAAIAEARGRATVALAREIAAAGL